LKRLLLVCSTLFFSLYFIGQNVKYYSEEFKDIKAEYQIAADTTFILANFIKQVKEINVNANKLKSKIEEEINKGKKHDDISYIRLLNEVKEFCIFTSSRPSIYCYEYFIKFVNEFNGRIIFIKENEETRSCIVNIGNINYFYFYTKDDMRYEVEIQTSSYLNLTKTIHTFTTIGEIEVFDIKIGKEDWQITKVEYIRKPNLIDLEYIPRYCKTQFPRW